jgi:hypothetical protein
MTRRRWAVAVGVAFTLLLGGSPARPQSPATDDQVKFAANAEMMKGHLLASRELYAKKQEAWAAVHAAHPVQELWSQLRGPLEAANAEAAAKLGALLERPGKELDGKIPETQYQATVAEVSRSLDDAVGRVVPAPVRDTLAFKARVVIALIQHVPEEYGEAVEKGKVAQAIEYQDAYAFFQRARALYAPIAAEVRSKSAKAGKEIDHGLSTLGKALAQVMPPARPMPVAKVEEESREIAGELAKVAGAQLAAQGGVDDEVRATRTGLQQAREAYKGGQHARAEELVTAAYLDHFEKVEGPLAKRDKALNERLERLIRTDLRGKIKGKAPLPDVEQLIETITGGLDQAERLLSGS